MPSIQDLAPNFLPEVRKRGDDYFRQRRVRNLSAQDGTITATVHGTDRYHVRIEVEHLDTTLDAQDAEYEPSTCTCPYFYENGLCKHQWATLRAAAERGMIGDTDQDDIATTDEPEPQAASAITPQPAEEVEEDRYYGPIQITGPRAPMPHVTLQQSENREPAWQKLLSDVRESANSTLRETLRTGTFPRDARVVYIVDVEQTAESEDRLCIDLALQRPKRGGWDRPRRSTLAPVQWLAAPDPIDRQIIQMLWGASDGPRFGAAEVGRSYMAFEAIPSTLRLMCQTGRCMIRRPNRDQDLLPLVWDSGPPVEFWLGTTPASGKLRIVGSFRRDGLRIDLLDVDLLLRDRWMFAEGRLYEAQFGGAFDLAHLLHTKEGLVVSSRDLQQFIRELYRLPGVPKLDLPPESLFRETRPSMQPRLVISQPREGWARDFRADVSFLYDSHTTGPDRGGVAISISDDGNAILRDPPAERAAIERLHALGLQPMWGVSGFGFKPDQLPTIVATLSREGWTVEASGKVYRTAGAMDVQVRSGIDWFDLDAKVNFGDTSVDFPQLLAAIRKGEQTIRLDDGTIGILPEEWLARYASLAALVEVEDGALRFSKSQVALLDALLATLPDPKIDETFERARQRLTQFQGVQAVDPPPTFIGELRHYQRDGLGWLNFLREFGFGGCLADDMGLGKTVQVLALLEARRRDSAGPSLVVVPKSLIFNWKAEAAKFTPEMRVLDQTGPQRIRGTEHLNEFDLVLTTYGTLRRDASYFKDFQFDYLIIDEAQAVKNVATASAKAVRLVGARHRLALSGTPIENHLRELWSLLDFLNPGMLGRASAFASLTTETTDRELLARAVRPFILRRTKGQVAKELPDRIEQTILCELEPAQRKLYDELRDHYRHSIMDRVSTMGLNKSRMHVLEALLRLRQAACHPGLIDPSRVNEPSAKLDALLDQLSEAVDEGHKVLVFSQFTSLLAIVRARLDSAGITYEYLDGQTTNRQARVERFQTDPDCKLFLISLKAGGLGLNLTAADYVFLLDPWWNPAVEAQAIDRSHRIGQTRSVFAYRLIAKDTVEEKVLALQQSKRDLADAIINEDNSVISGLGKEELELLLS